MDSQVNKKHLILQLSLFFKISFLWNRFEDWNIQEIFQLKTVRLSLKQCYDFEN